MASMRGALGPIFGFLILACLFSLLERRFPAIRARRKWTEGLATDLAYWAATPILFDPIARAVSLVPIVGLAILGGVPQSGLSIEAWVHEGHGPLRALPLVVQAPLAFFVMDLVGYWTHRLFHRGRWWRFHAIHHAASPLNWRSAIRVHPLNEVVNRTAHAIALVGLGFRVDVLMGVGPVFALYALLLHANVPWSFGPLRFVIASPVFHRWHHTSEEEGLDKNFAGLFPVIDLVFGTFHMPGRQPTTFGVAGETVPAGFWRQLVWPFRSRPNATDQRAV